MSDFLQKMKLLRPDLSDWVVHYTKGKPDEAKTALAGILKSGLKNGGDGICFTESPLVQFANLFELFAKYRTPMLAPYGIAVRKEWLFANGGRPVIYLPNDEKRFLGPEIEHLFEEYEPGKKDFTWLREWRLCKQILPLTRADCIVVLPNDDAARELVVDVAVEQEYQGPGMEPLIELSERVDWRFVTLEDIINAEGQGHSDERLIKVLNEFTEE